MTVGVLSELATIVLRQRVCKTFMKRGIVDRMVRPESVLWAKGPALCIAQGEAT